MSLSIRSASAADEANVVALWRACGLVVEDNDPARDFSFVMANPNYELLVACNADGVIGSIVTGHDSTRGWLSHISVAPAARRGGIGTELVRAAEAWLAARGVTRIHLTVRATNADVVCFYESADYNTLPSILMEKQLGSPSA
jgi:ribosomal protein S18 acetylase RimI-like enzyme